MANQVITSTPTALAGIPNGQSWTVQFKTPGKTHVETATSTPSGTNNAFIVGTNGVVTVKKSAGQEVYVWSTSPGGIAVYEPAA